MFADFLIINHCKVKYFFSNNLNFAHFSILFRPFPLRIAVSCNMLRTHKRILDHAATPF